MIFAAANMNCLFFSFNSFCSNLLVLKDAMDKYAGDDSHLPSIFVLPVVLSFLSFFWHYWSERKCF